MPVIPGIPASQERLGISSGNGLSIAQAVAPYEVVTSAGMQMHNLAENSLKRTGETQAMKDFSQLQINLMEKEQQLQRENIQNPNGFVDKYLNAAQVEFDNMIKGSDNKYYNESMRNHFQSMRPRIAAQGVQFEASQKIINQKQNLLEATNNLSVLVAKNPKMLEMAKTQLSNNFTTAQDNAVIPNIEQIHKDAEKQLYTSVLDSYINQDNAAGANKFLEDNANIFGTEYVSYKSKVLNAEEAQAKKFSNDLAATVEEMAIQGNLVTTDGEQITMDYYDNYIRDRLVPSDRIKVAGLVKSGGTEISNQSVILDLGRRARQGEDVIEDIYAAAASGAISTKDTFSLIDTANSYNLEGTKDPITIGRTTLNGFFDNEMFKQIPSVSITGQLAISEYEEWANSLEKKPTTSEALSKSKEIASKFLPDTYKSLLNKSGVGLTIDINKAKESARQKVEEQYQFYNPKASIQEMNDDPEFQNMLIEEYKSILGAQDAIGNQ